MGYTGSSLEDYWPHELIKEASRQIQVDGIKKSQLEELLKYYGVLSESLLQGIVKKYIKKKKKMVS